MTRRFKATAVGACFLLVVILLVGFMVFDEKPDAATTEPAIETQNAPEETVLEIQDKLNKYDNQMIEKHASKNAPGSGENGTKSIFGKAFSEMNGTNTTIRLVLPLEGYERAPIQVDGAIEVEGSSYEFKGPGTVYSTTFEGDEYFKISFDALLEGTNIEEEVDGQKAFEGYNSAGIIIVKADNPEIFKASFSAGFAESTAILFFGDDHETIHQVDNQIYTELGLIDEEEEINE